MDFNKELADSFFGAICDDLQDLIIMFHDIPYLKGQLHLIGLMLDEVEQEVNKTAEALHD